MRSYKEAAQVLHAALQKNRMFDLLGQGHDAAVTAPALVLKEVVHFLADD